MTAVLCMLTAAALGGVEAGWQPLDSGGLEYIIRIDPESADELKTKGIAHEVSPKAADIRRILVFVGQGNLPTIAATGSAGKPSPIKDADTVIRISAQSVEQLQREGVLYELSEAERDAGRVELFIGPPPRPSGNPSSTGKSNISEQQKPAGEQTKAEEGPRFGQFDQGARSEIPMSPLPPGDNGSDTFKAPGKAAGQPGMPPWAQKNAFEANKKPAVPSKSPPVKTQSASMEKSQRPPEMSPSDIDPKENSPTEKPKPKAAEKPGESAESETAKPWLPFTVSLLALFASLGGNVYLGWLHLESRAKYRRLLERLQNETSAT